MIANLIDVQRGYVCDTKSIERAFMPVIDFQRQQRE
jgi:hypothetical protein